MAPHPWNTILLVIGFLLSLFCLSEEFQRALSRLRAVLSERPGLRYLAYPLGVLFFLAAAALIIHALVSLAANRFSYD